MTHTILATILPKPSADEARPQGAIVYGPRMTADDVLADRWDILTAIPIAVPADPEPRYTVGFTAPAPAFAAILASLRPGDVVAIHAGDFYERILDASVTFEATGLEMVRT